MVRLVKRLEELAIGGRAKTIQTAAGLTSARIQRKFLDGDTAYFDIVAGVLQGDTLAPYLFIICLDNVLKTSIDKIKENGFELAKKRNSTGVLQGDTLAPYLFIICLDNVLKTSIDKIKENGFELTKKRNSRYPAKTINDVDYADDIAILANTPNQAETLLHTLERAAAGIGLHVNAHKTEYMSYNQIGNITTLDGTPLKLVDKFTYLGSSVSSTLKDIDTRHGQLSIGYRSYGNQT